jgi:dTDP-4-amino-4,6-dideoxygalactose transaminase
MLPGALRLGEREAEAAAEAVRELVRSKNLFPSYGATPDAPRRSRVRELERAFCERTGAGHAVAVNSGTSALVCGLAGFGIGPGDEVIVPGYTWVSTASAVLALGAVPVIAEVDGSLTLDPADVRRKVSSYTKAIVPVHMRGAPARMDALSEVAREHGLRVLEDVCQAGGGSFGGRALGSIGDAGTFSFQMSKILTAGEGGLLITSDPAIALRATMYQDSASCPGHGIPLDDWLAGLNLRMSELHAAVLLVQLAGLEQLLADMRRHKTRLKTIVSDGLEGRGVEFRTIHDAAGDTSIALVFFLPEPGPVEGVVRTLVNENVPATRLWQNLQHMPHDYVDLHAYAAWTPILQRRSWAGSGSPWREHPREISYSAGMCPVTMDLLRRAVHVDVSPDLSDAQVEQMGAAIVSAVGTRI